MKICNCGKQLASNARNCPECGKHFTHPFVKFLGGVFAFFVFMFVLAMIMGSVARNRETNTAIVPASASNDAELLLSRCGAPSKDDSTEYDNPRPPMVSRIITYQKAHLKFLYIPGGDAKIGDPPPYSWKLIGITDSRTDAPIEDVKTVLPTRMPCAVGH